MNTPESPQRKYKQTIIPKVDDQQFEGMQLRQLKNYVREYFNNEIRNTAVTNEHKNITVKFSRKGFDHILHARNAGYVKLKAIVVMKEMIMYAEYSNFQKKDTDDPFNVLGYFNYKCKVNIEDTIHLFRIVVRLTNEGKFYYDHAVKVRK